MSEPMAAWMNRLDMKHALYAQAGDCFEQKLESKLDWYRETAMSAREAIHLLIGERVESGGGAFPISPRLSELLETLGIATGNPRACPSESSNKPSGS